MGKINMHKELEAWESKLIIPQFCVQTWEWFLDALEIMGVDTAGASMVWTPPKRELVDPTREVPAIRDAIRSGLKTQSEAIRETGRDPEEFFAEKKADDERLDKLELILDSDPRKIQLNGELQHEPEDDAPNDNQ